MDIDPYFVQKVLTMMLALVIAGIRLICVGSKHRSNMDMVLGWATLALVVFCLFYRPGGADEPSAPEKPSKFIEVQLGRIGNPPPKPPQTKTVGGRFLFFYAI